MKPAVALLLLAALSACSATLDHQAELVLHPEPTVQVPSLLGAVTGGVLGLPIWGAVALIAGPTGDAAAHAAHVFVYPPTFALGLLPWLVTGPSWD